MKFHFQSVFKDDMQLYMELRINSMAWNTYRLDCYRLSSFDRFLRAKNFKQDIVSQDIINEWLKSYRIPQASLEGYIKTVRGFMQYRINLGKPAYVPMYKKKTDTYIPYIFSDSELIKIIACADSLAEIKPKLTVPHIYAEIPMIIRLLYCCGCRLGEVLYLKVKDINIQSGVITIKHAKRDKQRFVPVHYSITEILYNYCIFMGIINDQDAFLFPGIYEDTHLSPTTVERHFKTILMHLGIVKGNEDIHQRGPCLHCFRHCFMISAFRQLEKLGYPVDISSPYLSIYCGHESLLESEKYMKFSSEMFEVEMIRFANFSNTFFPEVDL
ncbi:MAG: tyrosine-type recombinase/integrase [Cellulosilyticaceae bacterium]